MQIAEVKVPKLIVNDDTVTVAAVRVASGTRVQAGDTVIDLETSKSVVEISSPQDGYVYHQLTTGMILPISSTLFKLLDTPLGSDHPAAPPPRDPSIRKARLSKQATMRAKELGIDLTAFDAGLTRVADVEKLAAERDKKPSHVNISLPNSTKCNRIVIYGAGRHAKMCIDILRRRNEYEIIGIVDQNPKHEQVSGVQVLGQDDLLTKLRADGIKFAVNAVGSVLEPMTRVRLFSMLKELGFLLPNLIHPSAVIEPSVKLGEGNQIMMGACVGSDVIIGDNCIVNSGAIISHDCNIGSHCHLAPGATLAGSVTVRDSATVGMGVTVYMEVTVGERSIISNGVNLFKSVGPDTIVLPPVPV